MINKVQITYLVVFIKYKEYVPGRMAQREAMRESCNVHRIHVGPFQVHKTATGAEAQWTADLSKEEVDQHLADTLSDPERELESIAAVKFIPSPTVNIREPTWKEVQEVVTAAGDSSAPRHSGFPYKVYKHCPELLKLLWKILHVLWRRGPVAVQWR